MNADDRKRLNEDAKEFHATYKSLLTSGASPETVDQMLADEIRKFDEYEGGLDVLAKKLQKVDPDIRARIQRLTQEQKHDKKADNANRVASSNRETIQSRNPVDLALPPEPMGASSHDNKKRNAPKQSLPQSTKKTPILNSSSEPTARRPVEDQGRWMQGRPSLRYDAIVKNASEQNEEVLTAGFVEHKDVESAQKFANDELHVSVNYDNVSLTSANNFNRELIRVRNMFGGIGNLNKIHLVDSIQETAKKLGVKGAEVADGMFNPRTGEIYLPRDIVESPPVKRWNIIGGWDSTDSPYHSPRHEIGHALHAAYRKSDKDVDKRIEPIYNKYFKETREGEEELSEYAGDDPSEMVAEAIAEVINGNPRDLAKLILKALIGD